MRKAVKRLVRRSASSPGIGYARLARGASAGAGAVRRRSRGRPRRSRSHRSRVRRRDRAAANEPADADGRRSGRSRAWVEPDDGACPATHPVKASSRAASSTCPAVRTTTAPTPTAATSTPDAAAADGLRASRSAERATPRSIATADVHAGARGDAARRSSADTSVSVAIAMSAASPLGLVPTSMSEMLTPASPRIVRDRADHARARPRCARPACGATAAGRRCGRRCRRCAALPACRTASPATCVPPSPRTVIEVHVVARVGRRRLAHRDAALLARAAAR